MQPTIRDGTELPAAVFRNGCGFTERHYESGAAYLRVVFDSKVKAGKLDRVISFSTNG